MFMTLFHFEKDKAFSEKEKRFDKEKEVLRRIHKNKTENKKKKRKMFGMTFWDDVFRNMKQNNGIHLKH